MNINNLSLLFLFYLLSTRTEVYIVLSENFLTHQENFKDFQLTLLHINYDENRFLHNLYKTVKEKLPPEQEAILKKCFSRKNIIATNEPLNFLKKLSIQSLDEKKIIKENLITIIEIAQPFSTKEYIFNIKIKIFDKKSMKGTSLEHPCFWLSLDNCSENSFKQIFLP